MPDPPGKAKAGETDMKIALYLRTLLSGISVFYREILFISRRDTLDGFFPGKKSREFHKNLI